MWCYRFVNIILIFCLVFLISCTQKNQVNIIPEERDKLTGEILVWGEYSFTLTPSEKQSYQKRIKEIIQEFNEVYPNVTVIFEFFEQVKARERFIKQVQRGAGANLLIASSDHKLLELINMRALQSLDDYNIDQSVFRANALSQARYQNKLYGIPLSLLTQALCYNTQKVKEPAKTLSDLVQQARKGYSVGLVSGFRETFWGTGIFSNNYRDKSSSPENITTSLEINEKQILNILQEGAWQQWMEWLKKAQGEPNFVLNSDEETLQEAFIQGKLAYLTCSSAWIPYARSMLGDNTVGVTLLPRDKNVATPVLRTRLFVFNRASSSKQLEIALKFAQFITNRQQQIKLSSQEVFIPINKTVFLNPTLYPIQATLMQQVQSSLVFDLDDVEQLTAIADVGEQLYDQVLAGELSSEAAAMQLRQLVREQ